MSDRTDTEILTLSCLMRIADSLETLTKRYEQLERDVKFYKEKLGSVANENKKLRNQLAARKAAYTKLKRSSCTFPE